MESIYRYMRRQGLVRVQRGRMVAGVCAGVGHKTGLDPMMVRLLFLASFLIPGPQLIAYFVAWFLMPEE